MPAVRSTPMLRLSWWAHRTSLRASRGRIAIKVGALPVLLSETTGRTSGGPRRVGRSFLEDRDDDLVAGSDSGEDRDPAWALNLGRASRGP